MGLFSVVIDELEDAMNSVVKQMDVGEQVRNVLEQSLNGLVGPMWEGEGADAFKEEMQAEVIDKLVQILGFTTEYTSGIKKAIDFLRELDDMLSNPIGAIGSIFGF